MTWHGQYLDGLRVSPPSELPTRPGGLVLWEHVGERRPYLVASLTEHDELRAYLLWAGMTVRQVDEAVGLTARGQCRRWVALRLIDYLRARETRRTA